ncbi:MAG TPA: cysteine--tRNA ligase [Candidatus Omnitrophota bacterium]|nr:cysteine--tRNA ligase [Candidatus Omnitrophota bacterium]HPT07351.1 cysteine--tRNA ligase [Candidatus Omnitrophota bacterium]
MPLQIYNSLTRKKEVFKPLSSAKVNMYTCGVTVYDACHIGHARSLYIFEVMRRYLEYSGYQVNFVRNITDIDDKIINRANELKVPWKELVDTYIASYRQDLSWLGVRLGLLDKDKEEPRATKNVPEIIQYIQVLIEKGFAYATTSGVYFSVRKFKEYGKLSGQSIDQMLVGVRKDSDEAKEDPLDFALWKASKPGEPSWPSPWGDGRPGWHIECSVMSQKYLACDTLDIHAGGRDLIFPHHENETAQSEAKTGKPFANYWVHHGLLTINGQKMSKSLGNFVTIEDFKNKYWNADLMKLFYLNALYSSPVDYTEEKIEEARKALERFAILFHNVARIKKSFISSVRKTDGFIEKRKALFIEAMDDNFNTPQALASLFDLLNETNHFIDTNENRDDYVAVINEAEWVIKELGSKIFGIFENSQNEGLSTEEAALLEERSQARLRRDFKRSDELRDALLKQGIIVEDRKDGTVDWRRKN